MEETGKRLFYIIGLYYIRIQRYNIHFANKKCLSKSESATQQQSVIYSSLLKENVYIPPFKKAYNLLITFSLNYLL